MRLVWDKQLLLPAYFLLIVVMFVLPLFSFPGYSVVSNTTSHLGAQQAPGAWVMNGVFIVLGLACGIDGWRRLGNYWFHKIVLSVFALALVFTAIFRHAPVVAAGQYNVMHDQLHSVFAIIVGFSYTLFAVSAAFVESSVARVAAAVAAAVLATFFSLLMFSLPEWAGIWQRAMFIVCFAWLIWFMQGVGGHDEIDIHG